MSTRIPYSTDLSEDEWRILEPLVPEAKPGRRPRAHETRELLNAHFLHAKGRVQQCNFYKTTTPCTSYALLMGCSA